jgi:hypothetical protein
MVVGVPGGTSDVLQLENSPFRKLNSLSLLPDIASARTRASTKMCCISGQGIEFFGSAISSALELCARVLVRFTLILARASACDSFGLAASAAKAPVISATALLESTAQLETMSERAPA